MSRPVPAYRVLLIAIVLLTAVASAPTCASAMPAGTSEMGHHDCGGTLGDEGGCVAPGEMHPDAIASHAVPVVAIVTDAVAAPRPAAPTVDLLITQGTEPVPREPHTSVLRI